MARRFLASCGGNQVQLRVEEFADGLWRGCVCRQITIAVNDGMPQSDCFQHHFQDYSEDEDDIKEGARATVKNLYPQFAADVDRLEWRNFSNLSDAEWQAELRFPPPSAIEKPGVPKG